MHSQKKEREEERTKNFDGPRIIQWREAPACFYLPSYDDVNHLRMAVLERETIRTKPNLYAVKLRPLLLAELVLHAPGLMIDWAGMRKRGMMAGNYTHQTPTASSGGKKSPDV